MDQCPEIMWPPPFSSHLSKPFLKPMKIERNVVHRRDAENTEMRYLFSLPLSGRQRKMLMPFGQGLTEVKNSRGALGLSLFCPLPAIASSGEAGGSQQKREKCFPLRSLRL